MTATNFSTAANASSSSALSLTPFRKVLIANRGEIALRIIRSARALGYRTVAVYSTADADARHVREADQAVCIGEPLPAQSYLCIPAILEAARLSGADAVHPGYGFLAENEGFAQACKDAGLVFIGPSAEAIVSMGNKAGAKTLMMAAGVPCIPGYQGEDQSEERLAKEASRIGFPVMIKATAGGGGRGMRLVPSAKEFGELLRSARSEAQSAFGDPEVILERAIVEPRHIEIQVFADRYGNAIHLGERDCSVQRRHQKLIEEAPSPAVDADLRARMGATAVAAVKAIRYEGAGTLEFLLDSEGNFYFMEMNTRLQVEHPVTEAITGLDLVAMQLRVAAGEPLPITQEQVTFAGHAIEVRLCAEDADKGFMPQSGTMALWHMPTQLRVEHAMRSGAKIPPYYDSMIAKLISHGDNREAARRKLMAGLEDAVALGVTTNQAFLHRCLGHEVFAAGGATTAFIVQNQDALLAADTDLQSRAAAISAVLLYETAGDRRTRVPGRRMSHSLPISLRFEVGGKLTTAGVVLTGQRHFDVTIGAQTTVVELDEVTDNEAHFVCDGLFEKAAFRRDGALLLLHYRGVPVRIEDKTRAASARQGDAAGDGKLRASMNGRVVAVMTAVGDLVEAGQPMVTLEAMKMEHIHAAPVAGKVTALHVKTGDQVAASRVVVEIEATVKEPATAPA
ncbi:acetyl-CoA carboxylase biotin carboxylase subunit [Variovorax sp. PAMC28562]|uniref:acetyl/propionyl/methylcrotonyl-CoA carboxylase subunit alpha n=1 Tax=Variovorax sp. PAMC28562 TaxID=2762323 RepID=UPI00164E615A|nr:acetyl-CoA carboxylase biotin carboxylase subunit [Variovorax sp. PAMC28562]QNK71881.1 acetyl-CoA carboxylase biotin carboxylase subunit [Variovorax sp. PAMC28562]